MKQILAAVLFFAAFAGFGNHVACSVGKHLLAASYSASDVALGSGIFFILAGLWAGGVFVGVLQAVLKAEQRRYWTGFVGFLLSGYFMASIMLSEYYDHPVGPLTEWIAATLTGFFLFGGIGALFGLYIGRNISAKGSDDAPQSSASA